MPPKYNTWVDYYRGLRDSGGPFRELFDSKISTFNEFTWDHVNNDKSLKLTIASNKYSFLLLPGANKTTNLLHNVVLVPRGFGEEPVMIGIQGN